MNNKGFMMAEVVVVSSIVLVALVGLYTSYNKLFTIYNQRVNYYDISTLYELATVRSKIDFSATATNNDVEGYVYNSNGRIAYYINKNDVDELTVENKTFEEYLKFLSSSLDIEQLDANGINNILVMEKCNSNGEKCKYAYLEVYNETS